MTAQEIAERGEFLRVLVGSKLHGLNVKGQDDRDEMGICIEPPSHVVGLSKFEQWVHRTAAEGERSGPDDLDLTIFSLRKWVRLALGGNPTLILTLFVPPAARLLDAAPAQELRDLAPKIVARSSGRAFLGYLTQQKERMLQIRGGRRKPGRPELVEAHGFDTKYAMHMLRLGFQGIELLTTGQITLPMPPLERAICYDARCGKLPLHEVVGLTEVAEDRLKALIDGDSPLQAEPDHEAVNEWLVATYLRYWGEIV